MKTKTKAKAKTPKTKNEDCEIVAILDRSGSMTTIRADMEGGFNTFIKEQAKVKGKCNVTLVQFSNGPHEVTYTAKPIAEVEELHFIPSGGTALFDALGNTLAETQKRVTKKGTKVIVLVITDGEENSSREWSSEKIKAIVEERTKAGWLFQFLGANIDAFAAGFSIGIRRNSTLYYDANPHSVRAAYSATSSSAERFRTTKGTQESLAAATFTPEEIASTKSKT